MPKRKDPNNYWDDERNNYLRQIFDKAASSDLVLAQKVNEKFNTTFKAPSISSQRSQLKLRRARTGYRSEKVKGRMQNAEKDPIAAGLQKQALKHNIPVYLAEVGVGRYAGIEAIGAGSAAAGDYHLFLFERSKVLRKLVPESALAQTNMRPLVNKDAFSSVMSILQEKPRALGVGIKGSSVLTERLKSVDILDVAAVVRDALGRRSADGTNSSSNYEMMGQKALGLLVEEYAWVMRVSEQEATRVFEKAMKPQKTKQPAPEPASP